MTAFRSLVLAILFVVLVGCQEKAAIPTRTDSINRIQSAIRVGDYVTATSSLQSMLTKSPDDRELITLYGHLLVSQGRLSNALEAFKGVSRSNDRYSYESRYQSVKILVQTGDVDGAIILLQGLCEDFPKSLDRRTDLVGLLYSVGRNWEGYQTLLPIVERGIAEPGLLTFASDRTRPQNDQNGIASMLKLQPKNRRPLLGSALQLVQTGEFSEALKILNEILHSHPDFFPAYLLQGRCLVELEPEAMLNWVEKAPSNSREHPDFWLVLGLIREDLDRPEEAARCFWEAIRLDPNFLEAHHHLSANLHRLGTGHESDEEFVRRRTEQLSALRSNIDHFVGWKRQSQRAGLAVVDNLVSLGRYAEAHGWYVIASQLREDSVPEHSEVLRNILSDLPPQSMFVPSLLLANRIDGKALPLPTFDQSANLELLKRESASSSAQDLIAYRMDDEAIARGLVFQYQNGDDPSVPGLWLHQSNGGGIAVLDIDLNGWPDVYFTQAGGAPYEISPTIGQMFLNRDGRFQNITTVSTAVCKGYGQGATSGDWNDDGFPDLACATIGPNVLMRNNGDGTFADVTEETGFNSMPRWSTSLAIADLNNDGYADIYEVNYLEGMEPFTTKCSSTCIPTAFEAAEDRVFAGSGDGKFIDQSKAWFGSKTKGRGLGVLVADLDSQPGLEVFIANDMSANFLWTQESANPFAFKEMAISRGVAVDRQGRPQACMGIAAGDSDGDSDIDLLVTNFTGESNAYYVQGKAGQFADHANRSGMNELSRDLLGFGTQFLDLDLDGTLELIVTNGHVGDHERERYGYEMPTQVFSLKGDRWRKASANALGPFFQRNHLGRPLALIDANRDRRPDVVIGFLTEPASLLVDKTDTQFHSICFRLTATKSQRDAIGTKIYLRMGTRTSYFQMMAGNGFQCSNQKEILAGLAESQTIDELIVSWPSGAQQHFSQVLADRDYLIIEGNPTLVESGAID